MKKAAFIIMIATICSKVFGFIRDLILSYYYGASTISDAYLVSITIPSCIFAFIASSIAAGYIPLYSEVNHKEGKWRANHFTSNLINTTFLVSTLIIIISLIFTKEIIAIFASGFTGETLLLTTKFTRITLLSIYFTILVSIFSGYLQIKENFLVPSLIGFPSNFVLISSIVLSSIISIDFLAYGYAIAIVSQFLFLYIWVKRDGYKHKFKIDLKDEYILKMISMVGPLILGVSVNQINTLVDRNIASTIAAGAISSLNYASKLNIFVQGIFVVSVTTVLYSKISKLVVEKDIDNLKKSMHEAITIINLFVIPATVGMIVFAVPIVKLLFARGAFDNNALIMTSSALVFYSIGMLGVGLRDILTRVFYSMKDTTTPMLNGLIGVIINIILNIVLSKYLGIGGLALATSISAICTTILLFMKLRKKIGKLGIKNMSMTFLKITIASICMGIVSKGSFAYLMTILTQNASLVISIGIGTFVYFIMIYFMKIEHTDVIIEAINKKLKGLKK